MEVLSEMQIEFLLEEPSAEAALQNLLPKVFAQEVEFGLRVFQSKDDLLNKLPNRLQGYRNWFNIQPDLRVVVLIDEDRQDCNTLKQQLEEAALQAGLSTKSRPRSNQNFQVLNRIAVEELEAWFLGDVQAIVAAYPGVPTTLENKRRYRDPDAIRGGTWETLLRVLQNAGHYSNLSRLPKIEAARNISRHMVPSRNRSKSFQVFRNGLLTLIN